MVINRFSSAVPRVGRLGPAFVVRRPGDLGL
jgi:hypothetical protein